jgi:dTMP kinase
VTRTDPRRDGAFITLEGVDGSGKSTQARALAEALRSDGLEVILTREPGGSPVAERIRAILLDPAAAGMAWATEVLLYLASRAEHVAAVIRPALERGVVVVCDRFLDSTLAYQGYGRDRGGRGEAEAVAAIREANALGTAGLGPERTYLIDLDPAIGLARVRRAGRIPDRLEEEGTVFLNRVRGGFLELAAADPERFRVVNGDRPAEAIGREIHADASDFLRRKGLS